MIESHSLPYQIVVRDNQRLVSLDGFLMDADQLNDWMVELRDEDPDLYSELVPVCLKVYDFEKVYRDRYTK